MSGKVTSTPAVVQGDNNQYQRQWSRSPEFHNIKWPLSGSNTKMRKKRWPHINHLTRLLVSRSKRISYKRACNLPHLLLAYENVIYYNKGMRNTIPQSKNEKLWESSMKAGSHTIINAQKYLPVFGESYIHARKLILASTL